MDGRSYFRPALFWQEIQPGQVCDGGLDFNMGMGDDGVNKGRLAVGDFDLEGGEPERLVAAVVAQTVVLPESEARDDSATVSKMLATAATWGDAGEVGKLLRCCYITHQAALPALAGAASFGYVDVVKVLLQAGCSPSTVVPGRPGGKNALHVACDAGQEAAATVLINAMCSRTEFEAVDGGGRTPVVLLKQADMGGIARRLESKALQQFDSSGSVDGSAEADDDAATPTEDGDDGDATPTEGSGTSLAESAAAAAEEEEEEEEAATVSGAGASGVVGKVMAANITQPYTFVHTPQAGPL